ncbi:MAG: hypothetical protein HY974_02375, partial [Candidatus Kerfeldbacteria bacterium]|nr:hypothetical protein [Candidatus Kerfeldbacteria bacterium]
NINQPTGDEVVSGEIIPPTRTDCADELDTECWNTYRNTEYGFEFKYPGGWGAEKSTNNQRKIYINSDTLKENEWGIINEGLQLGVLISQNNSQDTDISIDKFDFGMQVGPLKETKDVVINSKTAKVFVFEGLNFLAFPENTDIILSSHLEYRDYKRIISININTGGKNRYLNYDLFRDIILPTFRFD